MKGLGEAHVVEDLSIPSPGIGEVLIRVQAVSLNPADWIARDKLGRPGAGLGFDFAGTVLEVGEGAQKARSVGDRVAGFVHACRKLELFQFTIETDGAQVMVPTILSVLSVNI